MSIEAIAAAAGLAPLAAPLNAASAPGVPQGFSTLLDQVSALSGQLRHNESAIQGLALGETDNLHQVMMNLESARLQFDLLLQVRNKIMDAYQQLMSMQV